MLGKVVEEVFQRFAKIWELRIGGRVIETTGEHPFYTVGEGWKPCGELKPGERLLGRDGSELAVEGVLETAAWKSVFNVRVADWHTYFVGGADWGWAAWAHNAECTISEEKDANGKVTGYKVTEPDGKTTTFKSRAEAQTWAEANGHKLAAATPSAVNPNTVAQDQHASQRAAEARSGDAHRQVGDKQRVIRQGKKYTDADTGHTIYVDGDRVVVVNSTTGQPITQFKNTKANTQQRVREGKWIPQT